MNWFKQGQLDNFNKGMTGVHKDIFNLIDSTKEEGHSIMPITGTSYGNESLPIYRFVGGDYLNKNDYGMHWTHSYKEMEQMASEESGYVLVARHPGQKNIMSWDNPKDRFIMEKEIGGYEYKDSVFPEIPVRPGTILDILLIIRIDENGIPKVIKKSSILPFNNWFKKSQNTTVYHGTDEDFDKFDFSESRFKGEQGNNLWGFGIYVTPNKETAKLYGKNIIEFPFTPQNPLYLAKYRTTKELADYLNMSEDALIMRQGVPTAIGSQAGQLSIHAKEMGHDCIIVEQEIVVLDVSKINRHNYEKRLLSEENNELV